ncbi:MAG: hypothetical protein WBE58_21925, partial [Verrucomicrobiales bacterium]
DFRSTLRAYSRKSSYTGSDTLIVMVFIHEIHHILILGSTGFPAWDTGLSSHPVASKTLIPGVEHGCGSKG